jgi:hypothetical protein
MNKSHNIILALLIFHRTVLLCQPDSTSSDKQAVIINRLTQSINFDGVPNEEAWIPVTPLKMTMHSPVFGKEPTEKTDVRIAYDDRYLYVGAILYYQNADMIMSASFKRDYEGAGGDWFGILLDTYNDKENAVTFFTSPDALRFDASIQKDAVISFPDQMPMNLSWNTFWDVLTKKDLKGWSAEIRIPLSSLRFQEINGEVRMGLTVERWIPAKNEIDLFPAIPPNWGQTSPMKPSQAQEVIFRGIKPDKPLYIAPYFLAGYGSNYDLNNAETAYYKSDKPVLEAGLDVKYGLSGNMVMDLTLNTDFAQVEADDQQFNLTRYSLFFPEKRMFFLERASIFDFSLGGNSNLFYSRRIGLSDDGDPVRIFGGARIVGRMGKWDVGFLNMQTAPLWVKDSEGIREEILPSENFGVLRFRRQVINENSYIGTIFTSRLGMNGSYNLAYGVDGIIRIFGDDYLDFKWTQTFESDTVNNSLTQPLRFGAGWERRSRKGLGYNLGYSYSGIHFNPGTGFEMMDDYSSLRAGIQYGWMPGENSKLYRHSPEARISYRTYVEDGSLMTFSSFTGWSFQTKDQWQWDLFMVYNIENLKDSLEIIEDELFINPSKYKFINLRGNLSTPISKPLFLMLRTEAGQYYDGTRFSIRLQPTWNISRHFELGGTYNFDHLNFHDRDLKMTNHIAGLKLLYMLDTKFSVNAFVQYNTALNEIITNLRLRYNPKEGNDLYLVFNEGRNTNLTRELPNLPVYSSRAVMLKYTYTFNL